VLKLPFVLILENNQYAYSTPIEYQTAAKDFACRAQGYGIPASKVEGNDTLAVYEVTREAVERARGGAGPTLIEAKTMRMRGHAIHDDAKYVPQGMFDEWEKKDPIATFAARLRKAKVLDDKVAKRIDDEVKAEVEAQTEDAFAQPPADPAHEIDEVYAP
jgi:pyruvate dehydrogenase E1 component alpha subunit